MVVGFAERSRCARWVMECTEDIDCPLSFNRWFYWTVLTSVWINPFYPLPESLGGCSSHVCRGLPAGGKSRNMCQLRGKSDFNESSCQCSSDHTDHLYLMHVINWIFRFFFIFIILLELWTLSNPKGINFKSLQKWGLLKMMNGFIKIGAD